MTTNNINLPIIFSDGCINANFIDYASENYHGKAFLCSIKNSNPNESIIDYSDYGKDAATIINTIINQVDRKNKINRNTIYNFVSKNKKELVFKGGYAGNYEFSDEGMNISSNYCILPLDSLRAKK